MPDIHHKTEVGGVKLGLQSEADVVSAYRDLAERLGPRVAISAMALQGVELSLGFVRDPQFGPMVVVGAGGILVELLSDRVTALAPFGPKTARRLLDRLKVRRLLDGFRGGSPSDLDGLAMLISRFSTVASELGDLIVEMDVNPLICSAKIVAVDALIRTSQELGHGPHASR
jgi:acyl-CoA synthetase (NDP forming)